MQPNSKPLVINQAQIQFVRERSEPQPPLEQILYVQQQQMPTLGHERRATPAVPGVSLVRSVGAAGLLAQRGGI